ncbi:MAG: methyltransferase domain protein, partial [Chloroflexi bacterium]|nr:methyltransferase domain protein [Chloroflexota bacterium]
LCGNTDPHRQLFDVSRPIQQCDNCGLVYAEPSDNAAHRDYTEAYYTQGAYADYLGDRRAIHKNAARTLTRLERLVDGRNLLDVGCATGFFLEAARARDWTVQGIEISDYASAYAREELQLPVWTGSILSPPDGLPRFDVVTLWDTIEHLDRPDLALRNIRRLLNAQGVLVLSTGDYGSILRRLTQGRWRLFADPTHNFFFDERTLRELLQRTGFELMEVSRRGKWVSLSMILHQSPLPFAAPMRRWLSRRAFNPALYVNLWDVVTIFARPTTGPH